MYINIELHDLSKSDEGEKFSSFMETASMITCKHPEYDMIKNLGGIALMAWIHENAWIQKLQK